MFPKICGNACLEPLKFKFHNVSLSISTNVFQLDFNPLQFSHPWEDRKQTKNGTYDAFRNNCIILPVSCFKPKTSLEQLSRDKKMTLVRFELGSPASRAYDGLTCITRQTFIWPSVLVAFVNVLKKESDCKSLAI